MEIWVATEVIFKDAQQAEAIRRALRGFSPVVSPQNNFERELKLFSEAGLDASSICMPEAEDANMKGASKLTDNGFIFQISSLGSGAYDFWLALFDLLSKADISYLLSAMDIDGSGWLISYSDGTSQGKYETDIGGLIDSEVYQAVSSDNLMASLKHLYAQGKFK